MLVRALLLLLLPAFAVPAAAFLPQLSPERPVSDAVPGAASGWQHEPFVASNGELALAVWSDRRAGLLQPYAARIDAAGRVLDPLGINLTRNDFSTVHGVVWNGTHFAVAISFSGTWGLVFVAPDGAVTGMRLLELSSRYQWGDAAGEGDGARLLFLTTENETRAAVVDGGGDPVAHDIRLVQPGDHRRAMLAGSRGSEFLVLLGFYKAGDPVVESRTVAMRIDAGGRVLSAEDAKVGVPDDRRSALEGGPDGWLLASEDSSTQLVTVRKLDERGVATGETRQFSGDPQVSDEVKLRLVRESHGYTLAWNAKLLNGRSSTWAVSLPDDGPASAPRQLYDWPGAAYSIAIASSGGLRVAVTNLSTFGDASSSDVFVQNVGDALAATPPVLVTNSPAHQGSLSVAAGGNGYLVAWSELGAEPVGRLFVRRLRPDGTRQGESIEVARVELWMYPTRVKLVSNGATYLVTWGDRFNVFGRRMEASTGVWIDAEPFLIAAADPIALATDGTDVVAAWSSGGISTRRIRLEGDPVADPVVTVSGPVEADVVAIGSSGTDYLLAWQEGHTACVFCETPIPAALHAVRLRSDGTQLDTVPLVLVPLEDEVQPTFPAIAWNAGRYLVVWKRGGDVKGALVTPEGAVLELGETLAERPDDVAFGQLQLIAHRDQFILFTNERGQASNAASLRWTAVAFDARAPLSSVAPLPRSAVLAGSESMTVLSAARSGHALLVGYGRIPEGQAGGVPRVYTRLFGSFGPRRRAVR